MQAVMFAAAEQASFSLLLSFDMMYFSNATCSGQIVGTYMPYVASSSVRAEAVRRVWYGASRELIRRPIAALGSQGLLYLLDPAARQHFRRVSPPPVLVLSPSTTFFGALAHTQRPIAQ